MTFKEITKGILGAWKIPYLYFVAWRLWLQQRRNLTKWGRNYGLPAPARDETNAQYRKRVYAAINNAGNAITLGTCPRKSFTPYPIEKRSCFWKSGCSDSARCREFGSCVAAHQNKNKHEFSRPLYTQQMGRAKRPGSIQIVLEQLPQRINHPISSMALELHKQNEAIAEEWEKGGGTVQRVEDSIILSNAEACLGHLKICPECKHTATAVTNQCFNSNCINYGKEIE